MGLYTGLSGWGRRGFADPFSLGSLLNETGTDASHLGARIADLGPKFQVAGMIEWGQKLKPPNIPRASKKPPKNSLDPNLTPKKSHAEFLGHKNFQRNYVARICGNYPESEDCFENPKSSYPKKYLQKLFFPQKSRN